MTATVEPAPNQVQLIDGERALVALDAEWARLETQAGSTPFQTRAWMRAWLNHPGQGCEPWVLVVGSPAVALLPLALVRGHGLRVLRLMGHGWSDYLAAVPCEAAGSVYRALGHWLHEEAGRYDVIDFKGFGADVDRIEDFANALSRPQSLRLYEVCPRIDTTGPWDDYLKARKKKFRANLKRTQRRVDDQGQATAAVEPLTRPLFDELVEVERDSWKWELGTAFLQDAGSRELLRSALLEQQVPHELWTARVDGKLAGFAVVLLGGSTRYYYLPSFRKSYTDIGTWLMEQIVRDSFSTDVKVFDFMQGDESYKLAWSTGTRDVYHLVAAGRGLRGRAALAAMRLRFRLAESRRMHEWRRRWQDWRAGAAR